MVLGTLQRHVNLHMPAPPGTYYVTVHGAPPSPIVVDASAAWAER